MPARLGQGLGAAERKRWAEPGRAGTGPLEARRLALFDAEATGGPGLSRCSLVAGPLPALRVEVKVPAGLCGLCAACLSHVVSSAAADGRPKQRTGPVESTVDCREDKIGRKARWTVDTSIVREWATHCVGKAQQ